MKAFLLVSACSVCALSGALPAIAQEVSAQASLETPQAEIVITKHSSPVYPPAARQAKTSGDVTIQLGLRQDGSIESAETLAGNPTLAQAALESARKLQFECRRCSEAATPYLIVYTFGLGDCGTDPPTPASDPPTARGQTHIRVLGCTKIVDPALRIGSAKCLYLWKCGLR